MAYVYRHIRLDKNEPFYIGIGSDETYRRAYQSRSRCTHWHNIVNLTTYDIEIMLDDLTWEEACAKEKEFINLYGRGDLGLGPLCNKTSGGDGVVGQIVSLETKEKLRKAANRPENVALYKNNYKKLHTPKARANHLLATQKPVLQYTTNGVLVKEWCSVVEASRSEAKFRKTSIAGCCKGRQKSSGGFMWEFKNEKDRVSNTPAVQSRETIQKEILRKQKPVDQYGIDGLFIKSWISSTEAGKSSLLLNQGHIIQCCKGREKTHAGYIWKYKII